MTFISIGLLTAPNYAVNLHAEREAYNVVTLSAKIRRAAEFLWRRRRRRRENHGAPPRQWETLGASEKSVGDAAQGSTQSGLIMRPHRAKMSDELLETIMFLKCNNWFCSNCSTILMSYWHSIVANGYITLHMAPFVLKKMAISDIFRKNSFNLTY